MTTKPKPGDDRSAVPPVRTNPPDTRATRGIAAGRFQQCKALSKQTRERCRQAVVRGYDVCYFHGANATNRGGRPPTTGKKSIMVLDPTNPSATEIRAEIARERTKYGSRLANQPKLLRYYEQFLADPDLVSLQDEIAYMRARLADRIENMADDTLGTDLQMETDRHLAGISEQIGKLIERQHKIEYSEKNLITVNALLGYAARIASIINERVGDEGVRQLIRQDLGRLFGGLTARTPALLAEGEADE